jgi:hypothetical protein
MDNIVKLLGSDSFAEQLILNGETLPEKNVWVSAEETVLVNGEKKSLNTLLNEAIDAAVPFVASVEECENNYNSALSAKAAAVTEYNKAEVALDGEWRLLFQQGVVKKATFNEEEYFSLLKDIEDGDSVLSSIPDTLVEAYGRFVAAENDVTRKTLDVSNSEEAWKTAKKKAQEPVNTALDYWRLSAKYASELTFYKNAVSFDYLESEDDREDANNLARSFIYVTISIQHSSHEQGKAIADKVLERVKNVVPKYIEENMTVPDGYSGTNCQRITRTDNIQLTNPHYTTKEAIKYGILMAVVAGILASVLIVILDQSDKRLRDPDLLSKKLNVPLLGIVPTIEELKAEQAAKKKAEKTSEVK